jgi:acid phosphatase family membrane protein YuiD
MSSSLWRLFFLPYLSGLLCQAIKIFNQRMMKKKIKFSLNNLLEMGGMPSAHSAATTTLTTLIAIYYGINTPFFILSLFLSVFIIGEAYVVRGVISRHAEMINKLQEVNELEEISNENLLGRIGHTPVEVIMGVILGLAFALAFIGR